jgi:hypothetical protein
LFNSSASWRIKKFKNYAKRKEKKKEQNGYPQAQEAFEKEQTQEEVIRLLSDCSCSSYTHFHFLHFNY